MIEASSDLIIYCCNGAASPSPDAKVQVLEYREESDHRNVSVGLPSFVRNLYHIPNRTLDLLEIAAYVFAADRLTHRGGKDQVEYQSWSRRFQFNIRVRDHEFWSDGSVQAALGDALRFMTGDADYSFIFSAGHSTPPTSLFDVEGFSIDPGEAPVAVTLFSGGLDSLSGAIEVLTSTNSRVVLVSHQSQPGTKRTQRQLANALKERFPGRTFHYAFECHLKGQRHTEETQRTRSFLYSCIGFAIATAYGENRFSIYENGVTSFNLRRREDLANARASRTTHPQTIARVSRLLSLIIEKPFHIELPFLWSTKKKVIEQLRAWGHEDLISSAVSCNRTYQNLGVATHCGLCFQCVDRRFAAHAAGLEQNDDRGLYAVDIITDPINDREARTTTIDFVRQARTFAQDNEDYFHSEYLAELAEIVDYLPVEDTELDKVGRIWGLMKNHGEAVAGGITRMRELYDDPYNPLEPQSLLGLVAQREHLKPDAIRAVESIVAIVEPAIGEMFRRHPPKDEPDLNQKIGALIRTHEPKLHSEHPTVSFACARVIPDHELEGQDLLIEVKYIRQGTPPSKASDGMASDLTKYPTNAHILFLVYDPDRAISNDGDFRRDFEAKGQCTVKIMR